MSPNHVVYLLTASVDGTASDLRGVEELSGDQKFDLTLPASREVHINVQTQGEKLVCAPGEVLNSPQFTLAT